MRNVSSAALMGVLSLAQTAAQSQGFSPTPLIWALPDGGAIFNGLQHGFFKTINQGYGEEVYPGNAGGQLWDLVDMNGDGYSDLVISSERDQNGDFKAFQNDTTYYWKVFYNTGAGFEADQNVWNLPNGGSITTQGPKSFHVVRCPTALYLVPGAQRWDLEDMNEDSLLDLVITGEKLADGTTRVFSNGPDAFWLIHYNNGSGFEENPVHWSVPFGGAVEFVDQDTPVTVGFNRFQQSGALEMGAELWDMRDMNNDGKRDLVVTGAKTYEYCTQVFNPFGDSYWKIYSNTGTGFEPVPTQFMLPEGGCINPDSCYIGFAQMMHTPENSPYDYEYEGSQYWSVESMTAIGSAELVVMSRLVPVGFDQRATAFDAGSDPHWLLYQNMGSGFSLQSSPWNLPAGGYEDDNGLAGYYNWFGTLNDAGVGTEGWRLLDITGDGMMDLVVTCEVQSNLWAFQFQSNGVRYWRVYASTGSGFEPTPIEWVCPEGGIPEQGFIHTAFEPPGCDDCTGRNNWSLADMNGDERVDLVVTAEGDSNRMVEFSLPNDSYWKVYLNEDDIGLDETREDQRMEVYPNPAKEVLVFSSTMPKAHYRLVNAQAMVSAQGGAALGKNRIDVSALARGLYLLSVENGERRVTRRVVLH